jgi:hypothetical protein
MQSQRELLREAFVKMLGPSTNAWRKPDHMGEVRERREPMSCRIDRLVTGDNLVILRISGRITGAELSLLQDLLGQEKGCVAVDLKEVSLIDREVVKLLSLSEADGIELRNCPAYIREWMTRETE